MRKSIVIQGQIIPYELKRNTLSRNIRIVVHPEKGLLVSIPKQASEVAAERFIQEKAEWILKNLKKQEEISAKSRKATPQEIKEYKKAALELALSRLAYFNTFYNFTYRDVRIKDQKTRWGSCSTKGNLNFTYKIALLPPHLADYIIVHELCHTAQMNHSAKFWSTVAKTIPDYAERRKQLRVSAVRLGQS